MARLWRPWIVVANGGDPLNPPVVMGRFQTRGEADEKCRSLCAVKGCDEFQVEFYDESED